MIEWSAHLSMLFQECDPSQRPAQAAAAGFARVETWWPPAESPQAWVEAVTAAGLCAACVNADGGDLAAGERGFCNVPGRRDEAVAAAVAAAHVVTAAGGRNVNLLVGRRRVGVASDADLAVAGETVAAAARAVAPLGAVIVVEHLNPVDVDGPLLPTPADAARFVRAVDLPNVKLLFDAYHAAAAGVAPADALGEVADVVGHVQYADFPGRGAPGTGTVSLSGIVATLSAAGYDGAIGLEFLPAGDTASAIAGLHRVHDDAPFPRPAAAGTERDEERPHRRDREVI